jgi:hypothetical protein
MDEDLRKNPLFRRMIDCELVLRFFAFRKRSNVRGSIRSMLDRCMVENLETNGDTLEGLANDFNSRLRLANDIFGAQTFKYKDKEGAWQISQPLYDGVMVALDRLWNSRANLTQSKARIAEKLAKLLKSEKNFEVIIGKPNTAKAVLKRMELVTRAMERAI